MKLLVLSTLLALASCREKRSVGSLPSISEGFSSIGNLFRSPTPPPHSNAPVWKVHKYSGVQLRPISHEELAAIQPPEHVFNEHGHLEVDGHPPKAIQVHLPDYHTDSYPAADGETRRALAAIDSLGGLASFLPDGAQGRSLGRLKRSDEPEAEDRIGRRKRRKGLKLKKKALLALLKGGPVFGKFGGLGSLGSLGGLGGFSFGNFFGGGSEGAEGEEIEIDIVQDAPAPYPAPSGPYPAPSGPYPAPSGPYPPAVHTTVYRTPTHSSSFLEGFGFGGRGHEGLPVELPEPSLPQLPQLKLVPEAPKLPPVTISGNYKIPYSTGSYVSIKVPKPVIPLKAPAVEYGPPAVEYGPPAVEYGPPAVEYGLPAAEYGPPAAEYGLPAAEYGVPQVHYGPPSTEYGSPLPVLHSHSDVFHKDTFDNVLHHEHHLPQVPNDHFLPSAPAPPVYNAYQGHVNSYQAPVHEYSHTVDTTAVSGVYPAPPAVASAVYDYYPPPQGYSYDNVHSPSEHEPSVVAAEKGDTSSDDNTENPLNEQMQFPKELAEELQLPQRTDVPTEQESTDN